jgi:hypothetical protein
MLTNKNLAIGHYMLAKEIVEEKLNHRSNTPQRYKEVMIAQQMISDAVENDSDDDLVDALLFLLPKVITVVEFLEQEANNTTTPDDYDQSHEHYTYVSRLSDLIN